MGRRGWAQWLRAVMGHEHRNAAEQWDSLTLLQLPQIYLGAVLLQEATPAAEPCRVKMIPTLIPRYPHWLCYMASNWMWRFAGFLWVGKCLFVGATPDQKIQVLILYFKDGGGFWGNLEHAVKFLPQDFFPFFSSLCLLQRGWQWPTDQ